MLDRTDSALRSAVDRPQRRGVIEIAGLPGSRAPSARPRPRGSPLPPTSSRRRHGSGRDQPVREPCDAISCAALRESRAPVRDSSRPPSEHEERAVNSNSSKMSSSRSVWRGRGSHRTPSRRRVDDAVEDADMEIVFDIPTHRVDDRWLRAGSRSPLTSGSLCRNTVLIGSS